MTTTEEPEAPPVATKALDKLDNIIGKATRLHEWLAETGLGPKLQELVAQAWAVRHDLKQQQEAATMGQDQSGGRGPPEGSPGSQERRDERHEKHDAEKERRRQERTQTGEPEPGEAGPHPDQTLPGDLPPKPEQQPA